MDLHYQPINGQCRAGFVVLLHQKCKTKTKERQTTPLRGAKTAVGERKRSGFIPTATELAAMCVDVLTVKLPQL